MTNLQVMEAKGIRVLTTQQIAQCYGTTTQLIKNNFNYNKQRYIEGKHYISLSKNELKEFKARYEIQTNLKYAHTLYLWTEKGALLHAKSLNTDKAWEVYDYLVDYIVELRNNFVSQLNFYLTFCTRYNIFIARAISEVII